MFSIGYWARAYDAVVREMASIKESLVAAQLFGDDREQRALLDKWNQLNKYRVRLLSFLQKG